MRFGWAGSLPHDFAGEALLRHLTCRGLQHSGFMSVLYGVPAKERPLRQTLTAAEFARWRCYVARLDGQPAGVACLYLTAEGAALCAAGLTLPECRGRGCQTALLRRRLADAAREGCDLIVSQAQPGSQSQRNMERVGPRTAYTKAMWTAPAAPAAG